MKRGIMTLMAAACLAVPAFGQQLGTSYRLKRVVPVAGRQGVAADSNYYYVSDTRGLYKYDREWNLVASRVKSDSDPLFPHPELANHFGDIDVWQGKIYTGNEHFNLGRGEHISISVYDAATLQWLYDMPWCPESGQVECSGLAVDREQGLVWMSDWVDSRYVYAYDLQSGQYVTKMQCRPEPYWCQGIFVAKGSKMIFSADDGEASYGIADNLYVADVSQAPRYGLKQGSEPVKADPWNVQTDSAGRVVMRQGLIAAGAFARPLTLLREMTDFRRAGEIEGLTIDPVTNDLLVLNNRGNQIVLGMPVGPLTDEGYSGEVHEVYVYEKF